MDGDICQHEDCRLLACSVYDWHEMKRAAFCAAHLPEHGFCPNCLSNIFSIGESGFCAACEAATGCQIERD